MPESGFRLTRVATIMLGVREVERSVKSYRDVLGMSLISQFPGFAFIVGGGVTRCGSARHLPALCRSLPALSGSYFKWTTCAKSRRRSQPRYPQWALLITMSILLEPTWTGLPE